MKDLTDKQVKVLEFCKAKSKEQGRFPTVRAICEAMGWAGSNSARTHLSALHKKGAIKKVGLYYVVTDGVVDWRAELEKVVMAPGTTLGDRMRDALKLLEENPA